MGRALNMAKATADQLDKNAKAGEIVDAQFTANALRNPPSLQALKLQDMLMKNAGGRIAEDTWHAMPLAAFKQVKGFRNLTHEDVVRLFEELRGVTMRHVNHSEGHTAVYGMIAVGRVDMDEGNGQLKYEFDKEFRKVMEKSDLYAVLDYRAGLAMKSRYAHRLHEMIAFRSGREKQVEPFTVDALRARLGVQVGKLKTWTAFKQRVLDKAIAETNQSSRFEVCYRVSKRQGRAVREVELSWHVKADLAPVKQAQSDHSIARNGKRKEAQERLSFPATGSVKYCDPWQDIARTNCNWDHAKIADAFRSFCAQKNIKLDAKSIEKIFVNFCAKQPRI